MKNHDEIEIVYSKITGKRVPPATVSCINEPNMELMARAFINLYYRLKEKESKNEDV